jgi:hypothetical protein
VHESGHICQSVFAPEEDADTWIYTVSRMIGNSTFDDEALC